MHYLVLTCTQEHLKANSEKLRFILLRYTDEENFELTNYIKISVQGIAPDTSEEVIHGAIKRYFTSKKEAVGHLSSQSNS
uniref:Uncharacterized protein n=1 Tax=Magallana gigas TaxID=29159 RepID=A0A8W8MPL3_MAGGI